MYNLLLMVVQLFLLVLYDMMYEDEIIDDKMFNALVGTSMISIGLVLLNYGWELYR